MSQGRAIETREQEALQFILNHLPLTTENNLYQLDPAVHAFVRQMGQKENIKDILHVVDEMFFYYTKTMNHVKDQNLKMMQMLTPEQTRKLLDV